MPGISKKVLQAIQGDLDAALAQVGAKHRVSLSWGSGHYGEKADLKIKIAPVEADGTVVTEARAAWLRSNGHHVRIRGLDPALLGQTFTGRGGVEYRISGLLTRGRKYDVEATRVDDGVIYKFTAAGIRRATGTTCPECGGAGCPACKVWA